MRRLLIAVVLALAALGCGASPSSPSAPDASSTSAPSAPSSGRSNVVTAADVTFCVTETNRYRAMAGRAPLTESSDLDAFAESAAQADSPLNTAHSYYLAHGAARGAENEVLNWPLAFFDTVHTVVQQAVGTFWSEGPGGGHYENLVGPFREFGCGIVIAGANITVVQEFR